MRHILLLLLVLAIGGVLRAQSPEEAWLDGTLVSKADKTPLVNAFVVLRTADGADTPFSALTDEKGYFSSSYDGYVSPCSHLRPADHHPSPFAGAPCGAAPAGYASRRADPRAGGGRCRGEDSPCALRGSTLIFGEAAFAKARGGSVLDGLKLIPGLQIEGANKLKLYGISELVVYIDGRPQRMSQDEVIALLQGMSVSEIAQVELIREPGVEYSGVTTPILNIKRKTRADEGVKGFTSLVGTYHQLFSEQLSTRVNLNYGRSRSYVSYTLGNKRYRETTTLSSGVVDDLRVDPRVSHQVGLGTDLTLGKGHSLGAQFLGNYADERLRFSQGMSNHMKWSNLYATLFHTFRASRWSLQTTAEGSRGSSDLRRDQGAMDVATKDDNRFARIALDFAHRLSSIFTLYAGAEVSRVAVDSRLTNRADELTLREWNIEGYMKAGLPSAEGLWLCGATHRRRRSQGELGRRLGGLLPLGH